MESEVVTNQTQQDIQSTQATQPYVICWDIESNGLLNNDSIDYTASPYKIKDSYVTHCIVVGNATTKETIAFYDGETIIFDGRDLSVEVNGQLYELKDYQPLKYVHKQLSEFPEYVKNLPENSTVIAHNQINFDLLSVKLTHGLDYEIEVDRDNLNGELGNDRWAGKKQHFVDTMILSKTLNPDRWGGHSLDNISSRCKIRKIDFRPKIPKDIKFRDFAPDMLYYCIYDVRSNYGVYQYLMTEKGDEWNWDRAIKLEKQIADIITKQEHRGFHFDKELALRNIVILDKMMVETEEKVNKLLPPKKGTQAFLKSFTPPINQIKKDGSLSANIIKFADRIGAELTMDNVLVYKDKEYPLPMEQKPLETHCEASIKDIAHIKDWLVSLGWHPSEWGMRDLSTDTKKNKLSDEKFDEVVERYIMQSWESSFKYARAEHLELNVESIKNYDSFRAMFKTVLYKLKERGYGVKVLTSPKFTVGQEKETCPNFETFIERNPDLVDLMEIIKYLTYKHRRSGILGGGVDWEDLGEDEEPEKGFLANLRADGRIPTPAGTCDASTSRMKHRVVKYCHVTN